ncbi:UDP-3-O-(3-hydroxymyristoyl)glucosamine N-acyltransferase [Methyloceanibacter superfactus]|uniref:UDP-3-O-(3-hydroxymyristoyl)glucosamine N-acyltransferase n=1 Tax=Methyloceanibacter superfactus TaxID=1774969 RepID=UPI001FCD559D|nr:UDP-3-O-(3-hydroxymyristoyl)glucosamine N-acyltransferase [Methyloceanibacter superfactus]
MVHAAKPAAGDLMEHPGFFERAGPFSLRALAEATGSELIGAADAEVEDIRPLDAARRGHLSFLDNPKYLPLLANTRASACLVAPKFADKVPDGTDRLVTPTLIGASPRPRCFIQMPSNRRPPTERGVPAISIRAPSSSGRTVEAAAVIGPEARIGRGTTIAAGTVIGYRVHVGRDCYIGPNATITHTLVGNRVTIHGGTAIGQDGFGFAMGSAGHLKVPQIGRVIIQDDVEIGANSTIDRGALRDTIVGEGTKIDNLVQIGHNVVIGRHCIIVSQTGISGSSELGDFVALGGQVGVVGHVKIGAGAQIAGSSNVRGHVPPGARWGGTPAKPIRLWFRELTVLRQLAERKDVKLD